MADAEALPFAENTFDAVVIGFGVHHFPFPVKALAEAHGCCAPGAVGFHRVGAHGGAPASEVGRRCVRRIGDPAVAPPLSPAGAICEVATCLRLLRESGFVLPVPSAETINSRAHIDSARQLITLLNDGTVRMSSVIRSLPNDKSDLLIATLERSMECYREGDMYKVPVAAILAVGVKA
jgi:SAM-dependent methyltransferase